MTLEMTKSESGAVFYKRRRSDTLGGASKVSSKRPVAPVLGEVKKNTSRSRSGQGRHLRVGESGGAPTSVGVARRGHSVGVLDARGCGR